MTQSHISRRKHHFIYKTICLVTGKYYYGRHSTDNLEDGYLGSGTHFTRSVRKHGAENHVRTIVEHLPDSTTLKLREAEIVNQEMLKDVMCMNLVPGGDGGWEHHNTDPAQRHHRQAGARAMNAKLWANPEWVVKSKARSSVAITAWITSEEGRAAGRKGQVKAVESAKRPEANAKRKQTFADRKHQQGSSNSNFGKKWMNHPELGAKPMPLNEIEKLLAIGWKLGRNAV